MRRSKRGGGAPRSRVRVTNRRFYFRMNSNPASAPRTIDCRQEVSSHGPGFRQTTGPGVREAGRHRSSPRCT
ncbi:hypothetical protein D187_004127 [Cystobacter fuscus DSM 2262]|uniref:Uncharacterized protein n=1 Tax=Cystobacter fuscus (strain ATCC 25194 / DSM 2262 / NBRC 100088 / M29) TaxID=1242864 RepID=S9P587_CYSF2|nr:hypothetical protein D187_004127 [Cystobacter fuscus DSM 2262]